jgi:predicted dehydrogenase
MALRIVVLGLGGRGLEWARLVRASGVAVLAGAVDPDSGARARAAGTPALTGVPIVDDLDRLDSAAVDAALVVTPVGGHAVHVEQALERGLGVLVEKPFTLDVPSAARLVRLADARGLPIVVGQNYRYMRAHRTVRRLLREHVLGRLSQVTCHYWRPTHVTTPGLAGLDASALWETGIHHLDVLRHVLGRNVVGVSADVSAAPWVAHLRGTSARVLLEFEDGVRGEYSVSWESPGHEFFEAGQQFYARYTGERGTLHVLQRWVVLCRSRHWPRFVRRGRRTEPEEMVLLRQLASAAAGTDEPECSGRDNLQTIALLAACEQSWRTRRVINPQELIRAAGA